MTRALKLLQLQRSSQFLEEKVQFVSHLQSLLIIWPKPMLLSRKLTSWFGGMAVKDDHLLWQRWQGTYWPFPYVFLCLVLEVWLVTYISSSSSVTVEQTFSAGHVTISLRHSSLKGETICHLMILKAYLKAHRRPWAVSTLFRCWNHKSLFPVFCLYTERATVRVDVRIFGS